jgi:hypothetical protein
MSDDFEGFGPVIKGMAGKAPADRSRDTSRVFDIAAARKVKESVGRGAAVPYSSSSESPDFASHANEAIAMGNSGKPAKAKPKPEGKVKKAGKAIKGAASYAWEKLGLVDTYEY